MKYMLFVILTIFINSSFLPKENPIYKIEFTGIDCYFNILINNKSVYKNENQYKVSRTLDIGKFLVNKDSQQIEYFMYNRHTMMELTEKSDFKLILTKHLGNKIDTIHKSNIKNHGFKDEKEKMRFPQKITHSAYFLLN